MFEGKTKPHIYYRLIFEGEKNEAYCKLQF
jgi:hypothetical protein